MVALKSVAHVIPQSTLDYKPNLELLKPDYVVHGDDWKTGAQSRTCQQVIDSLSQLIHLNWLGMPEENLLKIKVVCSFNNTGKYPIN